MFYVCVTRFDKRKFKNFCNPTPIATSRGPVLPSWSVVSCGCTAALFLSSKSRPPGTRDKEAGATTAPAVEVELVLLVGEDGGCLTPNANAQAGPSRRATRGPESSLPRAGACRLRFRFTHCAQLGWSWT